MMRSLFSGVSGLRNHQARLDVIGNNIANVNTVAFKSSRVTFTEGFAQLLQGASRPTSNIGGTNPQQIGSGSAIGSIDQNMAQGTLETTGKNTDLAVQGNSFFIVRNGGQSYYTRAGNFTVDGDGTLISPANGAIVQGLIADSMGNISSSSQIGDIKLPLNVMTAAQKTTTIKLTGNLDETAAVGDTHAMGVTVFDATGAPHNLQYAFTNTGVGTWDYAVTCGTSTLSPSTGTVTFNNDGTFASFTGQPVTVTPASGAAAFDIDVNAGTAGDINGLAGFALSSNAVVSYQNGYQAGSLNNIAIDGAGVVHGSFTNGVSQALAQIGLARFNNPGGLVQQGDNMFSVSANSGLPVLGFAGTSDASSITAGALEDSNVDLSQEFTDMIVTQRGFQANARIITTSDQMLMDLVNLGK